MSLVIQQGSENNLLNPYRLNLSFQQKLKAIGCTPIEDLITEDFGALGTEERNAFEASCEAFIIGEQLKAERLKAGMTQEQLAAQTETKKSYISRIGNGLVMLFLLSLPSCL